jgi:hypothetical protein
MRPPAAAGTPRWIALLLALLIAASLALHVWYASEGLHSGRWWDERFSFQNIRGILESGSLRPSNGYYQALSYLPQTAVLAASDALHRLTGREVFEVLDEDGDFTATAYFLSRVLQTLYGAGSLLLTFLVGRRLFSPGIGLLGAFFLAVTPWHVQASTIYKPDVLLMLTVLLTVSWSLRALDRPSTGRWLLAGCGVALAASTKLNGAIACVLLVIACLGSEGTWGQRVRHLLAAAGASLALFAALNPYFFLYPSYFGRNLEHYTARAEATGGTRLAVPWKEARLIAGWPVHGPTAGTLAFAAGAALAVRLLRRGPRRRPSRVEGWTFLSFPIVYSLAYAAITPHFKGNNFVPVFPFTALLAAWGLAWAWRFLTARLPVVGSFAVTLLLVLRLAALPMAPFVYVYERVVPTTEELARAFLHRRLPPDAPAAARLVYSEESGEVARGPLIATPLREAPFAVAAVERLDELPAERLAAADGEIFPASRLDWTPDGGGARYLRRITEVPQGEVGLFEPAPFDARGPARIAIAHPWTLAAPERAFDVRPSDLDRGEWRVELPEPPAPGEVLSVLVSGRRLREIPRLTVGSRVVALHPVTRPGRRTDLLTDRLDPGAGPVEIRLVFPSGAAPRFTVEVTLLRWRPPTEAAGP